jgi:hypothetical protein
MATLEFQPKNLGLTDVRKNANLLEVLCGRLSWFFIEKLMERFHFSIGFKDWISKLEASVR